MFKKKSLVLLVILFPAFALCAASHNLMLVSAPDYYAVKQGPVVIYCFDEQLPVRLKEVYRFVPEGRVSLISAFPAERLLVIWGEGHSKGGQQKTPTGYCKIIHVEHPAEFRRIDLPLEPYRGYLLRDPKTKGYQIATVGTDWFNPESDTFTRMIHLHTLRTGNSVLLDKRAVKIKTKGIVADREIPWDNVIQYGENHFRDYHNPLLGKLDAKGRLTYKVLRLLYRSSMKIPPSLLDARKTNLNWVGLAAHGERVWVLTVGSKPEKDNDRYWMIFDKEKKKWNKLRLFGFRTRAQLVGDWLIFSEGFRDYSEPKGKTLLTGKHTFYNVKTKRRFEKTLGPNMEILHATDDRLYYRQGTVLYWADITKEGITEAKGRLSSKVLKSVHWAFSVPKPEINGSLINITLSFQKPEHAQSEAYVLLDDKDNVPKAMSPSNKLRVSPGRYRVYVGRGQQFRCIGLIEVTEKPSEQTCLVRDLVKENEKWFFYSPAERLAAVKAGKGVRIAAIGVKSGQKLMKDLAVDYVKAKAVIQMRYAPADEMSAVGYFLADRKVGGSMELLLLNGRPGRRAMKIHGKKWKALKPAEHVVAGRGVAIVVHSLNKLDSLTLDQVRAVFAGKVKDWKILAGGAGKGEKAAPLEIHRFGLHRSDLTADLFYDRVLGIRLCGPINRKKGTAEVLSALSIDPQGIAFVNFADLPADPDKSSIKVLSIGPADKTVEPTAKTIMDGSYPLSRRLYLYVSPKASDTTKDFVKFVLSGVCGETFVKHGLTW